MKNYDGLAAHLRECVDMFRGATTIQDDYWLSYVAIKDLQHELENCRNELCLRCGQYADRHKGACDGCKWRDM